MELFRKAALWQVEDHAFDWAKEKGLELNSSFPFPDLYLSDPLAQLVKENPTLEDFLYECLSRFTGRDYGHMSSLDLADNFLHREFNHKTTWLRGIWPSPSWGEVHLDVLYDMGLLHLYEVPPRALILEQKAKDPDMA